MNKAIDIHDRVMRGLLGRYYGYEVTTEGDAFQFVFHHATDAVAYAVAAQQALLAAKWPSELQQHFRTRTRYCTENSSVEDAQLGRTKVTLCRLCLKAFVATLLPEKEIMCDEFQDADVANGSRALAARDFGSCFWQC